METTKQKEKKAYTTMKGDFKYKNLMSAPHLVKVVVATGTGSAVKRDKNRNDFVVGRLAKITGQKPALRSAKKSIASFKIREGDPVGVMVTLRGARMYSFLDKLINVAIPRTKDFRGIETKIVDNIGNLTMSIKEHTIFPEAGDEELKDVFGMAVTIVTSAKTKKEALEFFKLIGIPFKK
ncbi:MAG: large subunit ribosomal protein [Patescibacteria group bacterium]|nr:large subunit ribosomal protein [Patescibacteria group bacterium]